MRTIYFRIKKSLPFALLILLVGFLCLSCESEPKFRINVTPFMSPAERTDINQRLMLFEYAAVDDADNYVVEIGRGSCQEIEGCIIETIKSNSLTAMNTQLFDLDKFYKWRVKAYKGSRELSVSPTYTFHVNTDRRINPENLRQTIVKNTGDALEGGYVFSDSRGAFFDENGEIVWFTTYTGGANGRANGQMLPNGNIIFLNKGFLEIMPSGKVISEKVGPINVGGQEALFFHHSVEQMPNGNFLLLGITARSMLAQKGDYITGFEQIVEKKQEIDAAFSIVVELDGTTGDVVWYYDLWDYIQEQNKLTPQSMIGDGHMNSVHYDAEGDFILVSLRDLCRVIKIDRKTKKVLDSYGPDTGIGKPERETNAFRRQHSAHIDAEGRLVVYNNDTGKNGDTISSVVVMEIPEGSKDIKTVWEFECDFGGKSQSWSRAKGDVDLLPNGNYLIGMGTVPRTLIVDKNKNILWECVLEQFRVPTKRDVLTEEEKVRAAAAGERQKIWMSDYHSYSTSWTPTLYPNYYTCEMRQKRDAVSLKINNEGFEENTIQCQLMKGEQTVMNKTFILKGRTSETVLLNNIEEGEYKVLMASNRDVRFVKKYTFEFSAR